MRSSCLCNYRTAQLLGFLLCNIQSSCGNFSPAVLQKLFVQQLGRLSCEAGCAIAIAIASASRPAVVLLAQQGEAKRDSTTKTCSTDGCTAVATKDELLIANISSVYHQAFIIGARSTRIGPANADRHSKALFTHLHCCFATSLQLDRQLPNCSPIVLLLRLKGE